MTFYELYKHVNEYIYLRTDVSFIIIIINIIIIIIIIIIINTKSSS